VISLKNKYKYYVSTFLTLIYGRLRGLGAGSVGENQRQLVDYISRMLRLHLDHIIPFSAIPENGWKFDGKYGLAHRSTCMLVNRTFS